MSPQTTSRCEAWGGYPAPTLPPNSYTSTMQPPHPPLVICDLGWESGDHNISPNLPLSLRRGTATGAPFNLPNGGTWICYALTSRFRSVSAVHPTDIRVKFGMLCIEVNADPPPSVNNRDSWPLNVSTLSLSVSYQPVRHSCCRTCTGICPGVSVNNVVLRSTWAVTMNGSVVCDITRVFREMSTDVSEEPVASIFRIEE
jgi:hypothetical protein